MMNNKDLPCVFIGSSSESLHIAKAIQTNLKEVAHVELWTQGTFRPSYNYLSDLLSKAKTSDFAIFILSPDDITRSRSIEEASPRDNIIFEAGLFMGVLGHNRVYLLAPSNLKMKQPTDLSGITMLTYSEPPPSGNWRAAVGAVTNQVEELITEAVRQAPLKVEDTAVSRIIHGSYMNLSEAAHDIKEALRNATDLKILAITGISSISRDESIVSTAELESYANIKKLRVLLMSTESRWVTSGLAQRRERESTETLIEEMKASHQMVEIGMRRMIRNLPNIKSGIRYYLGEPNWRLIMTDKTAFVSNYVDDREKIQSRDMPVVRFDNIVGSFYSAYHRRFNDIWHNESKIGSDSPGTIDMRISAGGVVYYDSGNQYYVVLVRRFDGNWVLPKGHKIFDDQVAKVTAVREVSEETGISPELLIIGDLLGSYADNRFPSEQKEVFIYSIQYKGDSLPELRPDIDHAEAKWFPLTIATSLCGNAEQKALIAKFARSKLDQ